MLNITIYYRKIIKNTNIQIMNLTGQLLISMPSLQDERFHKTVIYICAHTSDGAMGIVINKTLEWPTSSAVSIGLFSKNESLLK